jgi:lysozyme family protein
MNLRMILDSIIDIEGGYRNHPHDPGGPTRYGITEATARSYGYPGPMEKLPKSLARRIYRDRYVSGPGFDKVARLSEPIASELIDTGVNMGPVVAAIMLQRWLNAFNQQGSAYPDLELDGKIGPLSIGALKAFLLWRGKDGERVMLVALNCLQGTRYLELSERDHSMESFTYGWMLNRVGVLK